MDDDDGNDFTVSELDFDQLIDWLTDNEGVEVGVTMQGPPDGGGNTTLHAHGLLHRADRVQVIDPRPGRIVGWEIRGCGGLQLLEGDFRSAERTDDLEDGSVLLWANFEEVALGFVIGGPP